MPPSTQGHKREGLDERVELTDEAARLLLNEAECEAYWELNRQAPRCPQPNPSYSHMSSEIRQALERIEEIAEPCALGANKKSASYFGQIARIARQALSNPVQGEGERWTLWRVIDPDPERGSHSSWSVGEPYSHLEADEVEVVEVVRADEDSGPSEVGKNETDPSERASGLDSQGEGERLFICPVCGRTEPESNLGNGYCARRKAPFGPHREKMVPASPSKGSE